MNSRNAFSRRDFLMAGSALGLGALLPGLARAAGEELVAATFPGTWNEAHRNILKPAFMKGIDASVVQSIILGTDQISRLEAAKGGTPPFDVAIFDSPQVLDAVKQGLIMEYPVAKSPHYGELLPAFQDKWGPKISMQVIGIAYNPERVKTPPTRWEDLWDPRYKGRVGLTALNSQLGIAFLAELNRIKGGTDADFGPAFKALRELLPSVGAIAANLGAYATLWQQEQVDIAPYNFNFVQTLKGKGVPVEFVVPETGPVGWQTSMHVVAGSRVPELATRYIDTHLDAAVQAAMMKPPYDVIPTNGKVALQGAMTQTIARTQADLEKIRGLDWAALNPQRSALIDRFNREIRA
ncbi:extracellular solute-binding protein [Azoarcus sp. L1K30]|uniref:extracellular solute-binding protein n=1 Tax=Azoarcus sp. L1K30 TaxID=2820277 RepID=UPI001B829136|nr:extracellular solute-binding protein [Azoarcus sp. L1K30]MBR0567298.1 extracellular solute-binding protein [Azoarcus sp. L1K30]